MTAKGGQKVGGLELAQAEQVDADQTISTPPTALSSAISSAETSGCSTRLSSFSPPR